MLKRRKAGRPTLYLPEYCDAIVDYCKDGRSLTSFAGSIGVGRRTLTEWVKAHPEFSLAVDAAKSATAFAYEQSVVRLLKADRLPAGLMALGLCNFAPEDYKQRQELTVREGIAVVIDEPTHLSQEDAS